MIIKKPALIGQDDTSGASGKKLAFQSVLELLDGLADGRLADIELLGCL